MKPTRATLVVLLVAAAVIGCGKSAEEKEAEAEANISKELATAFASAAANLEASAKQAEEAKKQLLAERTVRLGQSLKLGNLELTPMAAEIRKVEMGTLFDDEPTSEGPFLVLTFTAKNISQGQVFNAFSQVQAKDSFGNSMDDAVGFAAVPVGSDQHKDIRPGEVSTIVLCIKPKMETAKDYTFEIQTKVDNESTMEDWACKFRADEVIAK